MAKKSWFKIEARGGENDVPLTAAIEIYDEIGGCGVSAKDFKNALADVGDVQGIELAIHSPGGSVLDGWAMYNLLKGSSAHVVAKIEGLAASMATVVAMAADEVHMPENAFFMIHNPSGLAIGDAEDMRDYADLLDKMQGGIRAAYASKTGLSDDKLDELMAAETWMTGSEAQAMGFVDVVTDALEMAAMNDVLNECAEDLQKNGIHVPTLAASIEAAEVPDEVIETVTEAVEAAQDAVEDEVEAEVEAEEIEETIEEPIVEPIEEPVAEISDLTAGGELIESAEQAKEAGEDAAPASFVDRVKTAILGRKESNPTDARAELVQLRGEFEALEAKLATNENVTATLRADVAARDERLTGLEAERRSVLDLVTEAGFAPTAAAELPMPDGEDISAMESAEAALAAAQAKGGADLYQAVKRVQELRAQADEKESK